METGLPECRRNQRAEMSGRTPRWLLLAGIVTAATGCDNVDWGGLEISLKGPPADTVAPVGDSLDTEEVAPSGPDLGPLLYAAFRQGDTALVYPVAELGEGGLHPLSSHDTEALAEGILRARLAAGGTLVLFHEGVRVGTLLLRGEGEVDTGFCPPRPRASGPIQLIPDAIQVEHFLALEEDPGAGYPFREYRSLESTYDQRVASLNLASRAITSMGISWPPSLLEARRDLQILSLPDPENPSVLATFLYDDQLQVAPAPESGYSLLVLGTPRNGRFDLAFSWHRSVGEEGKGAPRYFSRLDWDRDGQEEILLEVLGAGERWFAALDREEESWRMNFQDACPPAPDAPPPSPPLP